MKKSSNNESFYTVVELYHTPKVRSNIQINVVSPPDEDNLSTKKMADDSVFDSDEEDYYDNSKGYINNAYERDDDSIRKSSISSFSSSSSDEKKVVDEYDDDDSDLYHSDGDETSLNLDANDTLDIRDIFRPPPINDTSFSTV